MHVQSAVEDFDVFTRSLSIGAETMVMWFDPDKPMHDRYQVRHDFLTPEQGDEVVTISKVVNAFFRWEFNSCESIVRGGEVFPIDYANASPDVALTSLHYYFPWAMTALVRWCAFCLADGRRMRIDVDTRPWFDDRRPRRPLVRGEARRVPAARRRAFPGRGVRRVLRRPARHLDEAAHEWFSERRVRPVARRHGARDVPRARARAVRRALPRPAGRVVRQLSPCACQAGGSRGGGSRRRGERR